MIARLALNEAGVVFNDRRLDIHFKKEQLSTWYRMLNPKMTVPSLVDGSTVYRDSHDILDYAKSRASRDWLDSESSFKNIISTLENEFYAIEPFITTGGGVSILKSPSSHFMLSSNKQNINKLNANDKYIYDLVIKNFSTMPFCEKWLMKLIKNDNKNINTLDTLNKLEKKHIISSYPQIGRAHV